MTTRSRRYREMDEQVEAGEKLQLGRAVEVAHEWCTANFEEALESHVRLNVDATQADQQIRGSMVLPHGTGQETRVVVFAKGEKQREAEAAGADEVGNDDLIERVQEGWLEFDRAVATPDMMSEVSQLGPVLGPRNLMPNNKAGTVTFDVAETVEKLKRGQIEVRTDRYGIVHTLIGRASMSDEELRENLEAVLQFLIDHRPAGVKGRGQYFKSISLSPTMGPSVDVDPRSVWNALL